MIVDGEIGMIVEARWSPRQELWAHTVNVLPHEQESDYVPPKRRKQRVMVDCTELQAMMDEEVSK